MAGGIAAGALSGAAISGGMAAIQGKDVGQAALMGGLGGGISGGLGAYDAANVFNAPNLLADTAQTMATSTPEVATKIAEQGVTQAFPTVNQAGNALAIPNPSVPGGFISSETGQALASAPSGSGFTAGEMMAGSNFAPGTLPGGTGTAAEAVKTIGSTGNVTGSVTPSYYSGLGSGAMDTAKKMGIQALPAVAGAMGSETYDQQVGPKDDYQSPLRRLSPNFRAYEPSTPNPYYEPIRYNYASGGITSLQGGGGPVERMSQMNTAMNPQGGLYPQGMIDKTQYATPTQRPVSAEMIEEAPAYERSNPMLMAVGGAARLPKGDPGLYRDADPTTRNQDSFTAALTRLNERQKKANIKGLPGLKAVAKPLGNIEEAARGGVMSSLGGYSDGGRMLKGPGDGMSDSIPASIGNKQPARLADGEFVVPADVVSHLGNGSTDAGARKLYSMMDKIRKARTGKKRQAPAVKADRYMPA
jgi:hypothetical protein